VIALGEIHAATRPNRILRPAKDADVVEPEADALAQGRVQQQRRQTRCRSQTIGNGRHPHRQVQWRILPFAVDLDKSPTTCCGERCRVWVANNHIEDAQLSSIFRPAAHDRKLIRSPFSKRHMLISALPFEVGRADRQERQTILLVDMPRERKGNSTGVWVLATNSLVNRKSSSRWPIPERPCARRFVPGRSGQAGTRLM